MCKLTSLWAVGGVVGIGGFLKNGTDVRGLLLGNTLGGGVNLGDNSVDEGVGRVADVSNLVANESAVAVSNDLVTLGLEVVNKGLGVLLEIGDVAVQDEGVRKAELGLAGQLAVASVNGCDEVVSSVRDGSDVAVVGVDSGVKLVSVSLNSGEDILEVLEVTGEDSGRDDGSEEESGELGELHFDDM